MRKFITDNKISFKIGRRNSSVTILVGYAQHLQWNKEQLIEELSKEIKKDFFIEEEIERLWDYCKAKNYKKYWTTPQAKKAYIF